MHQRLHVSKSRARLDLLSEESCVVDPRCPFVVVVSSVWVCEDCNNINSSSCASLEVDLDVRHDEAAVEKVAGEYRPPCPMYNQRDGE